jgi:hypothetical protein
MRMLPPKVKKAEKIEDPGLAAVRVPATFSAERSG